MSEVCYIHICACLNVCGVLRSTLAGQAKQLRADAAVQNEALGRVKSELDSERFQK